MRFLKSIALPVALALLAVSGAPAGTLFGVDVGNYIVLYEGNAGKTLSINNFGTVGNRVWNGNIGIAGVPSASPGLGGQLEASGPGTLNGNINLAAANTGQASVSNTTVNGAISFGVASVQTAMQALNTLSSTFGAIKGVDIAIPASGTVNVTAGASFGGNRFFDVTSFTSNSSQKLIIRGNGSEGVVFNFHADTQFKGNKLLQDTNNKFLGEAGYAGLSPDQVLHQGDLAHPTNIIYGTFLMSFANSRITAQIFGGDSQ